ncbi:MAG: PEP-CTERM sorting domain-containing protein [Tepidisphaeraceae bacterium]|jgi:hypothetical protein
MKIPGQLFVVSLVCTVGTLCAQLAQGVIVDDNGTAIRNTTPPAPGSVADAAWQLEGQWGSFLGTPIAPGYFITAAHIGGSSAQVFQFQGSSYSIDATYGTGGVYSIPGTDLNVWKINGAFNTFAELYTAQNEVSRHLVVIGRGTAPGAPVMVNGQLRGWLWGAADAQQSWGENDVTDIVNDPSTGDLLHYEFNDGAGPNEAHLSAGDSGGGVFIQDNGIWKLAGINFAVDGPYSTNASGSNNFLAAIFNKQGLYTQGDTAWVLNTVATPGGSYSTRISTNAQTIEAIIPGPAIPLTLASLTFADAQTYAGLGNVKVVLFNSSGGNARIFANAPGAQSFSKPLAFSGNTDVLFTAGGTLTLSGPIDNSAGSQISVAGGGTLILSGPQTHGAGSLLQVDGSGLVLNTDAGSTSTRTLAINADPGSTVRLNSSEHLAALSLTGAAGSLAPGAGLVLDSLQLSAGATLDVGNSFLILHYTASSPLSAVQTWIADGAIFSSIPTAPGTTAALALVDNRALHLLNWHGEPLSDGTDFNELLLAYTYLGDTNLDGRVDEQDYLNIITNMGKTGASWFDGDLNGDGLVDLADYAIVTQNLGAGTAAGFGSPLAAVFGSDSAGTVPEPGALTLPGLGVLGLILRRRRAS